MLQVCNNCSIILKPLITKISVLNKWCQKKLHKDKIICTVVMNIMSKWLNILLHIWRSHIQSGQATSIKVVCWFVFSVTHVNLTTTVNLFRTASFHILSNSLFTDHDITWHHIIWATESILKPTIRNVWHHHKITHIDTYN